MYEDLIKKFLSNHIKYDYSWKVVFYDNTLVTPPSTHKLLNIEIIYYKDHYKYLFQTKDTPLFLDALMGDWTTFGDKIEEIYINDLKLSVGNSFTDEDVIKLLKSLKFDLNDTNEARLSFKPESLHFIIHWLRFVETYDGEDTFLNAEVNRWKLLEHLN